MLSGSGLQGQGLGRGLLDAALHHGRGCLRGMLNASDDPQALRRYALAGFRLHPQLLFHGRVDRALLPVVRHVREGTPGDRDLLISCDRRPPGAAHGPDHDVIGRELRLIVTDRPAGSGYAYVNPAGVPILLAASNRKAATALTLGGVGGLGPGRTDRDGTRLGRQRLGGRRRDGGSAGRLVPWVPGAAPDEGAVA